MKLFILLFVSCILCGCDARVHSYELAGYTDKCKEHGGIYLINNFMTRAFCNDGTIVHWQAN